MENILHEMRSPFASIQALALALVVTGAAAQGAGQVGTREKLLLFSNTIQLPNASPSKPASAIDLVPWRSHSVTGFPGFSRLLARNCDRYWRSRLPTT